MLHRALTKYLDKVVQVFKPLTPEQQVLLDYVTPGLKRNTMTRREKQEHLAGMKISKEYTQEILDQLYGATDK